MSQWKGPQQQQSDQQYISGTAKLDKPFEMKFLTTGKGIASASVEFNDIPGMRYGDLVLWEPETWYDDGADWLRRMEKGATVGFRGSVKERTWKGKDGSQKSRKEVNCFMIAPLWERPRRDR